MTNGRVCGWILLVGAFLSAVADVAAQALIRKSGVLSAVGVLDILAPDFLGRLIIFVRDGIHPWPRSDANYYSDVAGLAFDGDTGCRTGLEVPDTSNC